MTRKTDRHLHEFIYDSAEGMQRCLTCGVSHEELAHKGGGRESGGDSHRAGSTTASSERPVAANSAAHSHPSDCPCVRLHERIRELEAELERCNEGAENWHNEADTTHEYLKAAYARAERAEAAARTEATAAQIHFEARQRLEARVKELKIALQKALYASDKSRIMSDIGQSNRP